MDTETRIKRLRFRSWHRGWKETDIILGTFADQKLHLLDDSQLSSYEALLDENDADIWDWLIEKVPAKPACLPILFLIRQHATHLQAQ